MGFGVRICVMAVTSVCFVVSPKLSGTGLQVVLAGRLVLCPRTERKNCPWQAILGGLALMMGSHVRYRRGMSFHFLAPSRC